jgi:PRC-barrel domain protein
MISVRPFLFRAMYPRRHTGKKVGTCGALPRHGRFSSDRESTSPNSSKFLSPDGAIAGPPALSSQIRLEETAMAQPGVMTGKPLIESDRVEGTTVYDPQGNNIGSIKRLMIEKISGRVAYAVMSFGVS